MGSFWGMSAAGKEAAGFPREFGAWNFQQYKDALGRMNPYFDRGDYASRQFYDYNNDLMQNGIGSPDQIRGWGSQVMPGVNDAIGRMGDRYNDIMARYGTLPKAGDTMATINDTTNMLADQIGRTRNESEQAIERLRPGGDFQVATAARSFAPMIASTAGGLRRMGATGPQALAAMQRAEAARSRAMDDAAGRNTNTYVNAKVNLADQNYNRMGDWFNARNQGAMLDRGLNLDDWNTWANLQREGNANDLTALDLRRQEFGAGMGYRGADLDTRGQAAANVGNYGRDQTNTGFRSGDAARGFGGDASQAYQQAYQLEAPKAGWGLKMLSGMVPQALGLIPGVGPYLSAAAGPVMTGWTGAQTGTGYQTEPGRGGGGSNPYGGFYSWATGRSRGGNGRGVSNPSSLPMWGGYDPNG